MTSVQVWAARVDSMPTIGHVSLWLFSNRARLRYFSKPPCLSVKLSRAALSIIWVLLQAAQSMDSPLKWLRAHASSERLARELGTLSERYSVALQPTATALGDALGLSQDSTAIFAEEVVRGSSAAPLAQLVSVLAPSLRQLAGMGSWQVISPASGTACIPGA